MKIKQIIIAGTLLVSVASFAQKDELKALKKIYAKEEIKGEDLRYLPIFSERIKLTNIKLEHIAQIKYENGQKTTFVNTENLVKIKKDKLEKKKRNNDSKEITLNKEYLVGFGVNVGVIDMKDYYNFINNHVNKSSLLIGKSYGNTSIGFKAFGGFRASKEIEIIVYGEINTNTEISTVESSTGNEDFSLLKYGGGFCLNYLVPLNKKMDLVLSGSAGYTKTTILQSQNTIFDAKSPDYKLQTGTNLYATPKLTLQALIGYNLCTATDKNVSMNTSGITASMSLIY